MPNEELTLEFTTSDESELDLDTVSEISPNVDYTDLSNKPKINSVELSGNKSLSDLGVQPALPTVVNDRYLHTNDTTGELEWSEVEATGDYNDLDNKPQISGVTLQGNKSLSDLGLYSKTETDTLLDAKEPSLPTKVNDRYLHTSSSGELEWSTVSGGGSVDYFTVVDGQLNMVYEEA